MTRTGLAADLCRHAPEPYVEMHPEDAEAAGVKDGALVRVESVHGEAVAMARLSERQRKGGLFMPMHWSDAFAPAGRSNPLIGAAVDPTSGQPEFKHTPVRARPYRETWRGFFLGRSAVAAPEGSNLVWRRTPRDACHLHEFAGRGGPEEREAVRRALGRAAQGELVMFEDAATGAVREAYVADGRLEQVLYMTTGGRLPTRDWLAELFGEAALSAEARSYLLFGQPPGVVVDKGPTVCSCLKVGARAVVAAIEGGASDVDAVGTATGAGTNCGSCRPEIARLIVTHAREAPRHAA
jgi:assimilatory nitrate reductase catalytic subunit